LERLFLQKCHDAYPDLVDAEYDLKFNRYDDELTSETFGVVGNDGLCNQRMEDYIRTLRAYTGNSCLWEYKWGGDISCHSDRSRNTWSVENQRAVGKKSKVTFPSDTNKNMRTWERYFVGNRVWMNDKLHVLYNLYWRNMLIPAHELVHLYASNQNKFVKNVETQACDRYMTEDDIRRRYRTIRPSRRHASPLADVFITDRGGAYYEEWTASVANANIFILHMRQHYLQSNNQRHRSLYQLHVVQGMLYIVALISRMHESVQALRNAAEKASAIATLELGERWTLLSIDDDGSIKKVIESVTTGGWPNTYLKHISALMYAVNFFQEDDSCDFIQSILTADVWKSEVYENYKRKIIPHCQWKDTNDPRPIASWILESQHNRPSYGCDAHIRFPFTRALTSDR
jgi:hypothetical protein